MKKIIFNILFSIPLLYGQMLTAGCGELCSEVWWSKATLADLKMYASDQDVINQKDPYGFSPLHFAVSNNSPQKVEFLLNLGANVNAKSHYGFTPIFHAVGQTGDLKIIHLLLEAGANVNVKNKDGITPLHYAAWGTSEKLQSLLSAGANPIAKSKSGLTPYDMARDNENLMGTEALKILENANNN
jgi:ankyrin repeat protein